MSLAVLLFIKYLQKMERSMTHDLVPSALYALDGYINCFLLGLGHILLQVLT